VRIFLLGLVVGALLGVAGGVMFFEGNDPEIADDGAPAAPAEPDGAAEGRSPGRTEDAGAATAAQPIRIDPATPGEEVGGEEVEDLVGYLREKLVGKASHENASGWKKALPLLRDRRAEAVPILEDWIRRQGEIGRVGGGLKAVFLAYAEVLGADAVPLLSEMLFAPQPSNWHYALAALERIDDPTAADVFRRFQESQPPGVSPLSVFNFFRLTEAGKALVRDWAENPPPGHPRLQEQCRGALFRHGKEAEREEVWRTASLPQRLEYMSWRVQAPPFPERYRETVLAALESEKLRNQAYMWVAGRPAFFGEPICDSTLAAIEEEKNALGTGVKADERRRTLRQFAWKVKAARRAREHEEKLREALTPR